MHGHLSEQRHMWSVPDSSIPSSFSKDGRKISNGDCALFQAGDAPPFIGIIRHQTVDEEGDVKLGVNWLYRPADVKLDKGVVIQEVLPPNEIFYSFHKDEISSASLLHPCKVAFLSKGVQLPSGVASFVCRRVYDTNSKCLWWLTDRDYTNEHQEEVDQLLDKTRLEMQATEQSGGSSPTTVNGPARLKCNLDNIQGTLVPSQIKFKKRDRADKNLEPVKRSRLSKANDSDAVHLKQECCVRLEVISNITNKNGGLMNSAGVEQLVHLMQQDRVDNAKDTDLALQRTMLVGVLVTTDQDDCLNQFVKLGGLLILDDWLQEAHKGKAGDSGSPKEGDKVFDDLLVMLLRVLDRLPVDLEALKTCNIGKSVNHLRSHKNSEIQKKARNLVDLWKKRVEEEMKNYDTNSGSGQEVSWPCKQALGELVLAHGNKGEGSAEVVPRNWPSLTFSPKAALNRAGQGDVAKTTSALTASAKLSSLSSPKDSSKDSDCRVPVCSGTVDLLATTIKEEKNSCSSQSQNSNKTCLSMPGKHMGSVWKEHAGSLSTKASRSGSPHKISRMGIVGSSISGSVKEAVGGKLMAWNRSVAGERVSHLRPISDKGADIGRKDNRNGQKLIIKLPNPAHRPAGRVNVGTFADTGTPESQEPSSGENEKHETTDKKAKTHNNIFLDNFSPEANTESWESNDTKEGLTTGGNTERFAGAILVEECCGNGNNTGKILETSETPQMLFSGSVEQKGSAKAGIGTSGEPVVIATGPLEDCSIHSEAIAVGMDECGMNLLASVAATEISKVEHACILANTEEISLATGEDNLDQETKLNCAAKASSIQWNDDAGGQITFDLKEQKDGGDFGDHPGASRNDLHDECSKMKSTAQRKDSPEIFDMASETGLGNDVGDVKAPANSMVMRFSCTGLSPEHSSVGNQMDECTPSIQDVEQSREVDSTAGEKMDAVAKDGIVHTLTEQASVYAEPFTDQVMGGEQGAHGTHKIGKKDNNEQTQLHVKNDNAGLDGESGDEIRLEGDNEKDAEKQEKIVVECAACIEALDCNVREPVVVSSGLYEKDAMEMPCQVAKEVEKPVEHYEKQPACSKLSDKGLQDLSSACHFRNGEVKDNDLIGGEKQQCNCGNEIENKGKDQLATGKHLSISRSTTYTDDSHQTVAGKSEHVDTKEKMGSEEGNDADKGIITTVGMGAGLPDMCDDERKVPIKGCELSGLVSNFDHARLLSVDSTSPNFLVQQESQTVTSMTQIVQPKKAAVDEQITTTAVSTENVDGGSETTIRPHLDLNEGVATEKTIEDDAMISTPASAFSVIPFSIVSPPLIAASSCPATPIAVVAATKGPFMPLVNQLQSIGELGWKGSAATSAFHPAEPQRTPKQQHSISEIAPVDSTTGKQSGVCLDIDLNVADERAFEGIGMPIHLSSRPCETVICSQQRYISGIDFMASTSDKFTCLGPSFSRAMLDLDLNRTDESEEKRTITVPLGRSAENFGSSLKAFTSSSSNGASHVLRGFDLNNGPYLEDAAANEPKLQNLSAKSNLSSSFPTVTGWRMNGNALSAPSWFTLGNNIPALGMSSYSSARMEQPHLAGAAAAVQSILSSSSGSTLFSDDIYKGEPPMVCSDPPISCSNTTLASFPFVGFPFGSNFPFTPTSFSGALTSYPNPLGSVCFPTVPSQGVTAEPLSSSCVRPYLMSLAEVSGSASNSTWPRSRLDLNAGPEAVDMEVRKERLVARQPSINGQGSLEEQIVFCQQRALSVPLKRKDPEGGVWDLHSSGYKQSTWQ